MTRQERRAMERAAVKQQEAVQRRAAMPWQPMVQTSIPATWHAHGAMTAINAGAGSGVPVPARLDAARAALAATRIFRNPSYMATLMPAPNKPGCADLIIVRLDNAPHSAWQNDVPKIEIDVMGGTGAASREIPASESGLHASERTLHLRYGGRR